MDEEDAADAPPRRNTTPVIHTLDLSNRAIRVVELRQLPDSLTCLDLSRCSLDSAKALRHLRQLELLNLSYNRLTGLVDLQPLRRVKVLYLRSNRISSLTPLATLTALHSLDLECNNLTSLDALSPLWGMGQLTELRLRGNLIPEPAYRRACRAQLPNLRQLDGLPAGSPAGRGAPPASTDPTESALSQPEVAVAQSALQAAFVAQVAASAGQRLVLAHSLDEAAASPPLSPPAAQLIGRARTEPASYTPTPLLPEPCTIAASPSTPVMRTLQSPSPGSLPATFLAAADAAAAEAESAVAGWGVEASVVRLEVRRLETALTESEALRHREVGACARAAADQVEELGEALSRAERIVALATAENEELVAERATLQERWGSEAEAREARREREVAEAGAAARAVEAELRGELRRALQAAGESVAKADEASVSALGHVEAAGTEAAAARATQSELRRRAEVKHPRRI